MTLAARQSLAPQTRRWLALPLLLLVLLSPLPLAAQTLAAKLPRGPSITANFHAGNPSSTALLLLHGFLQVSRSEPMNSLAANLSSRGYTTLSPTMSLGINKRNQSTPCESMHVHTVEQDIAEIDYWMKWLHNKGYSRIVLIGFSSTGNFEALQYSAQMPHPALRHLILVSPNPMLVDPAEQKNARAGQGNATQKPSLYTLGYCRKNFAGTPQTYASYSRYDEHKLLELISQNRLPLDIILGSDDSVLPPNWAARIKTQHAGAGIHSIAGANHFFDGTAEFDLADTVETILKNPVAR